VLSVFLLVVSVSAQSFHANTYHRDHRSSPKVLFLEPSKAQAPGANKQAAAMNYLQKNAAMFGLPAGLENLQAVRVKTSLLGEHHYYQQRINGVPVERAEICVSIDRKTGQPYRVFNNTFPVTHAVAPQKNLIGKDKALDLAWQDLRVHGKLLELPKAELVYLPEGKDFRLTYNVDVGTEAPFGYWRHKIDAATGAILSVEPRQIARYEINKNFAAYKGPLVDRKTATDAFYVEAAAKQSDPPIAYASVNGTGKVFDPDPMQVLNSTTINDSSSASAFDAAYFTRTLQGITENAGTYSLSGPYVVITDFEAPTNLPSTTSDGNWTASRGTNAFNDAMTYYHIDQNQRYLQSLGFTGATGIQEGPMEVDSDGVDGLDNSYFLGGVNRIAFGHGGVDDNEDADVILHEYWHGLQNDINTSWGGGDCGAMGEGFGDYWGASYCYEQTNGTTFNINWAFTWDGHSSGMWGGRVMNTSYQYNPANTYPAHASVGGVYGDELWSTPIWQAFLALRAAGRPRTEMDTIITESNFGLGGSLSMVDMANAILATAEALFPTGQHAQVYFEKFAAHNLAYLNDPILLYPQAGDYLVAGSTAYIHWSNPSSLPTGKVHVLEYTPDAQSSAVLSEDCESGFGSWTLSHSVALNDDWEQSNVDKHAGTYSFFATNNTVLSDLYLVTPQMTCPASGLLAFWHNYNTESGYDGGVIEISTAGTGGPWTDLGGQVTLNGYNSTISAAYGNPIGGQSAFSGSSGGWIKTIVDLSAYSGQNIHVRFRIATDSSESATGWYVDDISLSDAPAWTAIGSSLADAQLYEWTVPSTTGANYAVRLKVTASGFSDGGWVEGGMFGVDHDDDSDGLANNAETMVFNSNPLVVDTDNDGMSDGDEVHAGTNPTNSQSLFMISSLAQPVNGRCPLTFNSVSGRSYSLRTTTNLIAGAWSSASYSLTASGAFTSSRMTATNGTMTVYVAAPPMETYYQVLVTDP
jgi:Zn-dependent metalloprotease